DLYPLSLHDALLILSKRGSRPRPAAPATAHWTLRPRELVGEPVRLARGASRCFDCRHRRHTGADRSTYHRRVGRPARDSRVEPSLHRLDRSQVENDGDRQDEEERTGRARKTEHGGDRWYEGQG